MKLSAVDPWKFLTACENRNTFNVLVRNIGNVLPHAKYYNVRAASAMFLINSIPYTNIKCTKLFDSQKIKIKIEKGKTSLLSL